MYNLIEDEEEEEEDDEDVPSASASQPQQGSDSPRLARQITVIAAPKKDKTNPSMDSEADTSQVGDAAETQHLENQTQSEDPEKSNKKLLGLKRH